MSSTTQPVPKRCGFLCRYKKILFAMVLTAMITRQYTMISVFHACQSYREGATGDAKRDTFLSANKNRHSASTAGAKSSAAPKKEAPSKEQQQYPFETIPSRIWKTFERSFPCYPPETNRSGRLMSKDPCHEGILFQRPMKVGSTTMTGIVMRLAHNRGIEARNEVRRMRKTPPGNQNRTKQTKNSAIDRKWKGRARCRHRSIHGRAVAFDYPHRNTNKSFLFSLVRDPTKLMISKFFYFNSHWQVEPTDAKFINYTMAPGNSNNLIRDLTFDQNIPRKMSVEFAKWKRNSIHDGTVTETPGKVADPLRKPRIRDPLNYTKIVGDILENYDFIAVTERMDESLVAIKLLLGLRVDEIIYAKASRTSGSFSNGPPPDRPCVYLIPPFLSNGMRDFFYTPHKNDAWIEYSRGDALLHRAASESLDRTIDEVFGRVLFERELQEFQNARAYAEAICTSEPGLIMGECDEAGASVAQDPNRSTTCYIWSEGCDHKCLNERVPNPIPRAVLEGTQKFGQ